MLIQWRITILESGAFHGKFQGAIHEQIRFFSNSGVFGVGNNGNCQGGVLMTMQIKSGIDCYIDLTNFIGDIQHVSGNVKVKAFDDVAQLKLSDLQSCVEFEITMDMAIALLHELAEKLDYKVIPPSESEVAAKKLAKEKAEKKRVNAAIKKLAQEGYFE